MILPITRKIFTVSTLVEYPFEERLIKMSIFEWAYIILRTILI